MTRLDRYVLREVVPVFALGAALYVCAFLAVAVIARIPWLGTMPLGMIPAWLAYQVPGVAMRAFPLAASMAVIFGFGRLTREGELGAARSGGVSLARMTRPLIGFGAALAVLGLILAEFIVPVANQRTRLAWWDSVNGGENALAFLSGRQIAVGGYALEFASYDRSSRALRDVRLEAWMGAARRTQLICFAQRATLETQGGAGRLELRAYTCRRLEHARLPLPPDAPLGSFIAAERGGGPEDVLSIPLPQSRETISARNLEGGFDDPRPLSALWQEWRDGRDPANRSAAVELSARTAWTFASLIVLALAVPLAAVPGRSMGASLALTLLVTSGYYALLSLGQVLAQQGVLPALAGPWLANAAFLAAGVLVFSKRGV